MYLIDTNVWLERLLDREGSEDVGRMLDITPSAQIHISDFSLHSIGVILGRLKSADVLPKFIRDLFINGAVGLVSLTPEELSLVVERMSEFTLDFDDAYQYVAAERTGARIISYDKDFDRTKMKRKTPIEIIKEHQRQRK